MQAAIGCAQLEKLPGFIQKRKENFQLLYNGLKDMQRAVHAPKSNAKKRSELVRLSPDAKRRRTIQAQ